MNAYANSTMLNEPMKPSVIDDLGKRVNMCVERVNSCKKALSRQANALLGPCQDGVAKEASAPPTGALVGQVSLLEQTITELESIVARFS